MKTVREKLALLFVLGAVLLNMPVLGIFNRPVTAAGVPILYLYLFGIWLVGIAAVFMLARARWEDEEE